MLSPHALAFFAHVLVFLATAVMATNVLTVANDIKFAFLDSGAPPSNHGPPYTTIFALHGEAYYSPVFAKVIALAPAANIRFVAITRRDYNGSTPYSPSDLAVLSNGTDTERAAFLEARGREVATFIHEFIKQHDLPPPTTDRKNGGIALLGWSLGNSFSIATVANILAYPEWLRGPLAAHLRALILQEPPSVAIGTPLPPQTYSPQIDSSIPANLHQPAFVQWITSYFQHGDLATRDPDVLSFVLPATFKPPSVYNMSAEQLAGMTNIAPADGSDGLIIANLQPQLLASYKKALFNETVRRALPHMNVTEFTGDVTAEFGIVAFWQIQDDNAKAGNQSVRFKLVPGANHFLHWDDPETAIATYVESLGPLG